MKPLNTEERKKSFITFLLFFIVTIGVVVGAVYFGMQVPFKQADRLKEQVATFQRENALAEAFAQKMAETKALLDSVNKNGVQATIIDGQITENIKRLNALVDNDSSANKQLYHSMVQSFVDLQIAKQGLREASNKDANLATSSQELVQLKSELSMCKQENLQYQQMMRNPPAQATRPQQQQ